MKPCPDTVSQTEKPPQEIIPVEGEWEVEMLPTLDNKWGDFRLPATDEKIGPEARRFRFIPLRALGKTKTWMQPAYNDSTWSVGTYGFGAPMEVLVDGSSQKADGLAAAVFNGTLADWEALQLFVAVRGREQPRFAGLSRTERTRRQQLPDPRQGTEHAFPYAVLCA